METVTEHREVRYSFTREELRELGLRLALRAQEIVNQKAAKKSSGAAFNAAIAALEDQAMITVRALNERAEWREMECPVTFNDPHVGRKTIRRPDTGEVVAEEAMTPSEMQRPLAFQAPPATDKPKTQ